MRLKDKKLVAFDFDGTLVDSMGTFADIAARVMNRIYGTPADVARRQYIETSGLPFFQQLKELHPGHKENSSAAETFEAEKALSYFDQKIYPDVVPTTTYLKKHGMLTATSSNNFQELVDEFISRSELALDFVLGFKTDSFCKGRPHFAYLIAQTGLDKDDMIFIGDSLKDAERAADFDIDFIGKTGLFSKEEFKKRFPKIQTINGLDELIKLI